MMIFISNTKTVNAQQEDVDVEISGETQTLEYGSDFEIEDGVLKDYTGSDTNVVIPSGVKTIDRYSFYNNKNIVTVTIPNDVV